MEQIKTKLQENDPGKEQITEKSREWCSFLRQYVLKVMTYWLLQGAHLSTDDKVLVGVSQNEVIKMKSSLFIVVITTDY